jgi:hypothetical protein
MRLRKPQSIVYIFFNENLPTFQFLATSSLFYALFHLICGSGIGFKPANISNFFLYNLEDIKALHVVAIAGLELLLTAEQALLRIRQFAASTIIISIELLLIAQQALLRIRQFATSTIIIYIELLLTAQQALLCIGQFAESTIIIYIELLLTAQQALLCIRQFAESTIIIYIENFCSQLSSRSSALGNSLHQQ